MYVTTPSGACAGARRPRRDRARRSYPRGGGARLRDAERRSPSAARERSVSSEGREARTTSRLRRMSAPSPGGARPALPRTRSARGRAAPRRRGRSGSTRSGTHGASLVGRPGSCARARRRSRRSRARPFCLATRKRSSCSRETASGPREPRREDEREPGPLEPVFGEVETMGIARLERRARGRR